ncbi:MAG: fasciclin domain-containing protein, partial [Balneola sp.]
MNLFKRAINLFTLALVLILSFEVKAQEETNILELTSETETLSTLATAVEAADLEATFQSEGPYTVFAPTNEAFENLPEGVLNELLKPENKEKLVAVLTYHVVPGEVMSDDVTKTMKAKTIQGSNASIKSNGESVMIENAEVVKADMDASNGVVHVIDEVILPPSIKKALNS